MQVIEFVGAPGSGKTSTLRELQRLPSHNLSPIFQFTERRQREETGTSLHNARKVVEGLCSTISLFDLAIKLLRYGLRERRFSLHMLKQVSWALRMAYKVDYLKRYDTGTHFVMDQGLLQLVGSLSIPSRHHAVPSVANIVSALCQSRVDAVVWFDCDPRLALERVRNRRFETLEKSRFVDGSLEQPLESQMRMIATLQAAVQAVGLHEQRMLKVNGESTPAERASRINAWMAQLPSCTDAPIKRSGLRRHSCNE